MPDLATNVLSYGDNLDSLRRYLPDASVDLVSLDPPFNSNRDNIACRESRQLGDDGLRAGHSAEAKPLHGSSGRVSRRWATPDHDLRIDVHLPRPRHRSAIHKCGCKHSRVVSDSPEDRAPERLPNVAINDGAVVQREPQPVVCKWFHAFDFEHLA